MIGPTELALLALASYRGTQLAVHDTILDAPRARIFDWHSRRTDSTLRTAAITLISCTYCMGWWVSGVALAAWLAATGRHDHALTDVLTIGVEWFAVAGGQALLSRWDDSRKETP